MDDGNEHRIVVGVDGSEPSRAALRWALGQAELTGGTVRAVTAWDYPSFYNWEGGAIAPADFESSARETLAETVETALRERSSPCEIRQEVVQGGPARALLRAAEGADLLVVGSRGHGGFVGALLGSVSHQCVHHALCPVVIVHR